MLNREAWLTELAKQAEPFFRGYRFDPYRITCGWPITGGIPRPRGYRVGECHGAKSSKGGTFELFISPTIDNPLEVAGVILHEMAHVLAGTEAKHGTHFLKVCNHAGLTKGKSTQRMPGPVLDEVLQRMIDKLGPYPHSALLPVAKVTQAGKVVGLVCSECGCKLTISRKWIEESGYPICGCGNPMREKNAQD